MGRLILILTAVGLLGIFVIISKTSLKSNTIASPTADEAAKKTEKERPVKAERDSRANAGRREKVNRSRKPVNTDNPSESSIDVADTDVEDQLPDPTHATVKGNDTPVYSVNSRESGVVSRLKKGDKVSTDLEITGTNGRWTLVKKSDLRRPGFVLDEGLQRTGPSNKNSAKHK